MHRHVQISANAAKHATMYNEYLNLDYTKEVVSVPTKAAKLENAWYTLHDQKWNTFHELEVIE